MDTNHKLNSKLPGLVLCVAHKINVTYYRFLNASPSYLELSGNIAITCLVVKQRVDACCKAAVGEIITDGTSIHAKAQFISRAEVSAITNHAAIISLMLVVLHSGLSNAISDMFLFCRKFRNKSRRRKELLQIRPRMTA